MEISWIKLKTKMFDDEKIQLIEAMPEADAILVIWVKLLIQAGRTNANGYILLSENIPYTPEMLSTVFRRPLQIIKFALKVLSDLGMIEVTNSNVICISNWEKHQNIEGLDKVREQNRVRQAKHREQKRLLLTENNDSVTLQSRTVTQQIKTEIKNKEEESVLVVKFAQFFPNKFIDNKNFILAWQKWIAFNDEREAPVKPTQAKEQLKYLADIENPIKLIELSITNNWKGLKYENKPEKPKEPEKHYKTTEQLKQDLYGKR